jgi:hypothetical protein
VKSGGTEYSCHPPSRVSTFWNQITRPTPNQYFSDQQY